MAYEKLPGTANGLVVETEIKDAPGLASITTETYTGPTSELEDKREELLQESTINDRIGGMTLRTARGRGSLVVNYRRVADATFFPDDQEGVQELYGMDTIEDIAAAPYFDTLADEKILDVRTAVDQQIDPVPDSGWSNLQKSLYKHYINGKNTFYQTHYELRISYQTSWTADVRAALQDQNTVVSELPTLYGQVKAVLEDLDGEWLKRSTTVTSAGRGMADVVLSFLWAPKWSIVYGGTFGEVT